MSVYRRQNANLTAPDLGGNTLLIELPDEPWMEEALCRHTDPTLFFPNTGGPVSAAKKVCAACPVTTDCLAYAMRIENDTDGGRIGVYGGLSPNERDALALTTGPLCIECHTPITAGKRCTPCNTKRRAQQQRTHDEHKRRRLNRDQIA